jgi:hypothetical protein
MRTTPAERKVEYQSHNCCRLTRVATRGRCTYRFTSGPSNSGSALAPQGNNRQCCVSGQAGVVNSPIAL